MGNENVLGRTVHSACANLSCSTQAHANDNQECQHAYAGMRFVRKKQVKN